jgi:hypothetical protein
MKAEWTIWAVLHESPDESRRILIVQHAGPGILGRCAKALLEEER